MSGKELFEGMSYVDERYVDEAEQKTIVKQVIAPWIKIVSMAACLCLVLFSMYNLIPYWDWSVTEQAAGEAAARPESAVEPEMGMEEQESASIADEAPASRAPEMMVRIQEVTETGFIGTVENMSGFMVFEDGTQITVTVDLETNPDFDPNAYKPDNLILVMYTSWDENEKTIVASIMGIVEEPIID